MACLCDPAIKYQVFILITKIYELTPGYIFLAEAWVPANAGTHAEPSYVYALMIEVPSEQPKVCFIRIKSAAAAMCVAILLLFLLQRQWCCFLLCS